MSALDPFALGGRQDDAELLHAAQKCSDWWTRP